MVDDDDAEQPRQHGGHHFGVGSRVEVLTNEDHGRVYFTATIIPPKVSKNPEQLHVRYHTLLASEDRPHRRKDFVNISFVRPPPPSLAVTERFEANDIIDAFHNDGWRKGIVSRVVGNDDGEMFKVIFNESADEFEFRRSAIRPHWDWFDGVWAGLQNLGGLAFGVGKQLEVSIEGKNGWIPAVVVRGFGNGGFLVEFDDKSGRVKGEFVDSANVRPSPPILKEKGFGKSERVEAFFDFRWWSGMITETRVKNQKNGYNVFFEEMNLNKVINVFDLRAYMYWKDGKWFLPCSSTSNSEIASSLIKRRTYSKCSAPKKHKGELVEVDKFVIQEDNPMRRVDKLSSDNSSVLVDEGSVAPNQDTDHLAIGNLVVNDKSLELKPQPKSSDNSSVLIDEGLVAPNEVLPDSGWPFAKRSLLWKDFESMEVFRKIPQKLHFQPLSLSKEIERQGLAISYMVIFSNVVERCCRLKIRDPKCVGEDLNSTLLKLEAHGFDLAMVRDCLMKFMEAKDKEEKLVHEGNGIKNQIEEHMYNKSRNDRQIHVINDQIRRLQEQLELAQIGYSNEVQQIARLQAELDQIQLQIDSVRCNFEALTASLS